MPKRESNAEDLIRKRRRHRRQILGFFLCLLAVVGLGNLIWGGVKLTRKLFDNNTERASYEQRLTYVVMLDMLPFESLEKANQSALLESCIWAALFNEDSTLYQRDASGALLLPSADVDRYAAQLFGPDFKLTHGTFESEGMTFMYDEATACYTIPITGQVGNYTPKVVEISGTRSVKRVTVGYLVPYTSAADFSSNRDTSVPVKYYDYLFTRNADGQYYLTSMEESKWVPEVSVDSASATPDSLYQPADPNSVVDQATKSSSDSAIAQELENAQSSDSAAEGTDSAAEGTAESSAG